MILEDIKRYAQDCIAGTEISGEKHKWACRRLLRDIERIGQPDFPYVWNERQARSIIDWFSYLRLFCICSQAQIVKLRCSVLVKFIEHQNSRACPVSAFSILFGQRL